MVRLRSPAPYFNGGIPERPKGADCKSVVTDFAGPNPASPTKQKTESLWLGFLFGEVAYLAQAHKSARWFAFEPQSDVSLLNGGKAKNLRHRRIPSFPVPSPCGSVCCLSIAKAMVYHHALACISSPQAYIISRRLHPLSQ